MSDMNQDGTPKKTRNLVFPLLGAVLIAGTAAIFFPKEEPASPIGDVEKAVTGGFSAFDRKKCDLAMQDPFPYHFGVIAGCALAENPVAMRTLGYRAIVGVNETPLNVEAAKAWLNRAAKAGDREAKELLKNEQSFTINPENLLDVRREIETALDCKRFPEYSPVCTKEPAKLDEKDKKGLCDAYLEGKRVVSDYHRAALECNAAAEQSPDYIPKRDEAIRLREWHEAFAQRNGGDINDLVKREDHYRQVHAAARTWKKTCITFNQEIPACTLMPTDSFYMLDVQNAIKSMEKQQAEAKSKTAGKDGTEKREESK